MKLNLESFQLNNKVVAVACSGGVDSMALLYYMQKNSILYGFTVKAVNVEHGIRGQASIDDTAFVKDFCKKHSIPLKTYTVNALEFAENEKLSIEQAARKLRYDCFDDAVASGFTDLIATAHHIADNTETVLFNVFRGCSLKGVKGIDEVREYIFRPLLSTTKEEIVAYAKKNDVPFVTDQTNLDTDYTRNFLRHNVIPKVKEVFPSVDDAILRLSVIAKQEDAFLDQLAGDNVYFSDGACEIPIDLHPVLFNRAVIIALKKLGVKKDYEKMHADLTRLLCEKNNGDKLSLPKNLTAVKEYDKIVIYQDQAPKFDETAFSVKDFKTFDGVIKVEHCDMPKNFDGNSLYLDADKIPPDATLRLRQDGDTFTKFGGKTKKLKDYLIDVKYPQRLRNRLICLCHKKNVLAIVGIEISDLVKVDKSTKNVLKLTYTKH